MTTTCSPEFELRVTDGHDEFWFKHTCVDGQSDWEQLPLWAAGWSVAQREPLSITPSVNCTECGCHGFITNGQWIPA